MIPTTQIVEQVDALEERFGDYHQTCRHLRRFWDGHMWEDSDAMSRSLVSVFRDMRKAGTSDREPDVKVTLPLIESIVSKYMALLVNVPQISVLTPPKGYADLRKEETRSELADTVEKFLYGLWEQNRVSRHFKRQAFYLPLFGSSFTGAVPNFKTKTIEYVTRSPENAYPIWDEEHEYLEAIAFKWEIPEATAKRRFPGIDFGRSRVDRAKAFLTGERRRTVEIIEWYDRECKRLIVGDHDAGSVQHDLGFVNWMMTPFYMVPDTDFGKGIIEGNIPLFQKLNMLDSLELQAIIENVFARLVLENPFAAPEDIDDGPGATIPLQQGGKAYWLHPPETTTDLSRSMARSVDFLQRGSHMPGSMYGESLASSITTGKAQHESILPTGNMVEYVQGNIGDTWERINAMSCEMTERIFAKREVTLFGRQFTKGYAGALLPSKSFSISVKGKDLKGWSRHNLIFQPVMSQHEKVVMGLQLAGGGLVSKKWQREQIGITDNDAMQQEILNEQLMELQLATWVQMMSAGQMAPDQIEQAWMALDAGMTPPEPGGVTTGMGLTGGMPMMPGAAPGPMAMGGPPEMGAPLPPATNPADMGPGMAPSPQGQSAPTGAFPLERAITDFQSVKKIAGRVFLVGEIVVRGATDGPVEVSLTNPIDKATLVNGLPDQYRGQLSFHTVEAEPGEQYVEVTPGSDPTPGGGPLVDHPDTIGPDGITPLQGQSALPGFEPPLASSFPAGGFQGSLRS